MNTYAGGHAAILAKVQHQLVTLHETEALLPYAHKRHAQHPSLDKGRSPKPQFKEYVLPNTAPIRVVKVKPCLHP